MPDRASQKTFWLKRTAAQIYTQLPEDVEDARLVVELLKEFLERNLDDDRAELMAFGAFKEDKPNHIRLVASNGD